MSKRMLNLCRMMHLHRITTRIPYLRKRSLLKSILSSFSRFQSQDSRKPIGSLQAEELNVKGILRVSGPDVKSFLQGLTTNDVNHLENGRSCIYSTFLNTKGRILFDTLIYKSEEENVLFIECDSSNLSEIDRHLKMFKVRKKIDICDISSELKVWTVFDSKYLEKDYCVSSEKITKEELNLNHLQQLTLDEDLVSVHKDPRLSLLGARALVKSPSTFKDILGKSKIETSSESNYHNLRYRLGIAEGASELPAGKCFPHETNCDYLHGVSFHKGCYIGQEVTARTQHTGVVRKRLMPVIFESEHTRKFEFDTPIKDTEKDLAIGKIRGVRQNFGIALLRVSEALEARALEASNVALTTFRPGWWPIEVPKEKVSAV